MRNLLRASIMLLALFVAACGTPTTPSGASTPSEAPATASPASAASASTAAASSPRSASTPPEASAAAGGSLQGATWQWVRLVDPTQEVTVENPENYTLTFAQDNTLAIMADCNSAAGTYQAGPDGSITITVGPTTLVGCPPGSRGDEYVEQLGFDTRYFFNNGQLNLELMADGGTLTFEAQ